EVQTNDERYHYRKILLESFASYGIKPSSKYETEAHDKGIWESPGMKLDLTWTHFDSLKRDRDEIFRFIWQNRKALEVNDDAYTEVLSVRPCTRIASDGFTLHETVAEYVQMITVKARELPTLKWEISPKLPAISKAKLKRFPVPVGMPPDQEITIYGGGSLIF